MIVDFSKNPLKQIIGISYWNKVQLSIYILCAGLAYYLCLELGYKQFILPAVPISVLGGAVAIFLGFRNSSAYDRWWEARKIWGALVNNSRSFGLEIISYCKAKPGEEEEMQKWVNKTIKRHIGWTYALRSHLRKETFCEVLPKFVDKDELMKIKTAKNIPTQLLLQQGKAVVYCYDKGWIEEFRLDAIMGTIKKFYDDQGKSERIKNTIFPFYYNYFTKFFLWLFTFCLPFTLVGLMNSPLVIPISVLISFAFNILNKTGEVTETPFEGRAADTPLSAICRTIEIDLLQMLGEEELPAPQEVLKGKFGVQYQP